MKVAPDAWAQISPVAPPAAQFTADCARPVYATDRFVCDDPQLRAADSALRGMATRINLDSSGQWIEGHSEWFRRRSMCAFQADQRACVVGAYAERRAVLEALDHQRSTIPQAMQVRCASSEIAAITNGSPVVLYGQAGVILGVAFAPALQSPWKDYATATRKGSVVTIETLDGRKSKCRPVSAKSRERN